jgi:hypothetical protein
MATSLSLENDSSLAQGYIKVNGSTAATLTTSGITGNLTGNVTGDVTGNADTSTKFSTTTGSAPAYACRAWVNFDGTRDTTGAVSTANTNRLILASGNVTSVLRGSSGSYTITFTTAMSDSNYSVQVCANLNTTNPSVVSYEFQTTSSCKAIIRVNSVAYDPTSVSVQIFGN